MFALRRRNKRSHESDDNDSPGDVEIVSDDEDPNWIPEEPDTLDEPDAPPLRGAFFECSSDEEDPLKSVNEEGFTVVEGSIVRGCDGTLWTPTASESRGRPPRETLLLFCPDLSSP